MKTIVVKKSGGSGQLALTEVPDLEADSGHLLVRVEHAGVNYVDIHQRRGDFPVPTPFTPGMEGVGTILEVGADVAGFKAGQRVAWIDVLGSYAEQALIPAARAIPLPAQFKPEQGLLLQPLTASFLVAEYRHIRKGDTALVHSAAGGVGQLLVQWLKHLGAFVVATASTSDKIQAVRKLGADVVVNNRAESILDAVKRATNGRGVDIAFDAVGKDTLADTIAALAARGTAVSFGGSSGPAPPVDPQTLMPKAARLATGALFVYIADPDELKSRSRTVLEALQEGWLKLDAGRQFALADAALAHDELEARRTVGKLSLIP